VELSKTNNCSYVGICDWNVVGKRKVYLYYPTHDWDMYDARNNVSLDMNYFDIISYDFGI
jgi:hypothetical protein